MKKLLLCSVLLGFITVGFAQVTTSVTSTIEVGTDGSMLTTIRASYLGSWPTSPQIQYYLFKVEQSVTGSTGKLLNDYYVKTPGGDRSTTIQLFMRPGSYSISAEAWRAVEGSVSVCPDGYSGGTATLTVQPKSTVVVLNIPAPAVDVEVIDNSIVVTTGFSSDNLSNLFGVDDYWFEIVDFHNEKTDRFYTNLSQYTITDCEVGLHSIQVRVVVQFDGMSTGTGPLSKAYPCEIKLNTNLVLPWFAQVPNMWFSDVLLTCKNEGISTEAEFSTYQWMSVNGRTILSENKYSYPFVSSKAPILIPAEIFAATKSGQMTLFVEGCDCEANVIMSMEILAGLKGLDGVRFVSAKSAKKTHLLGGLTSGSLEIWSGITPGVVVANFNDVSIHVTILYHLSSPVCDIKGDGILESFTLKPHENWANSYTYEALMSYISKPLCDPRRAEVSFEIIADQEVVCMSLLFDSNGGGFGVF